MKNKAAMKYRAKRLAEGHKMITVMLDEVTINNLARISPSKTQAIRLAADFTVRNAKLSE
jgi:hypothetical protein